MDRYAPLYPTDLDDNPSHRARFSIDHSWGLVGDTFRARSTTYPETGLTGTEWALDGIPLSGAAPVPGVRLLDLSPDDSLIRFQVLEPGLHFLSLTATWDSPGGPVHDRVLTPLYLEAPPLAQLAPLSFRSHSTPSSNDLLSGAQDTLANLQASGAKPTLLVISDFLEPGGPSLANLALSPDQVANRLAALGPVEGLDPDAGLGAIVASGLTRYGQPLTHAGQTLVDSLLLSGQAHVIFASGLDADTGMLDRAAIQNALLLARHGGGIDALLWGLPSSAYLPAVLQNAMRPMLGLDATPMIPWPASGNLPAGAANWRDSPVPLGVDSIFETLWLQSFLEDAVDADTPLAQLGKALVAHHDRLPPALRPVAAAFANDQSFDAFLQDQVLALSGSGIPFVVPADECPELPGRPMTLVGANHILGAITAAAGSSSAPHPLSCLGPDRRAAYHGTGIDFVAPPGDIAASVPIPFLDNSLGAAARVAVLLGRLGAQEVSAQQPWKSGELAGALATQADPWEALAPWTQGAGLVRASNVSANLPMLFPRTTQLVFPPLDPLKGRAVGIVQTIVQGTAAVALAEAAPASQWGASGSTTWRFHADERGAPKADRLAPGDPGHLRLHHVNTRFERVSESVGVATHVVAAEPSPADGTDVLLPGLLSGASWISTPNGIVQLPFTVHVGTILDVYRFLPPQTPVSDTTVCLGLPIKLLGDLTQLRETAHELEFLNTCIYWANTDASGVARFYTPLPLAYEIISFFNPHFEERALNTTLIDGSKRSEWNPATQSFAPRTKAPVRYPQIRDNLIMPSPANVSGARDWADATCGECWDGSDPSPVLVTDLPHPLAIVPVNRTYPAAVSVHWRYRDNVEATHILPVPSLLAPEFMGALNFLPSPVARAARTAAEALPRGNMGLLETAPELLNPILGTVQDAVKAAQPVESASLDALLGRPLTKALPVSVAADPTTCGWGYGHSVSPLVSLQQARAAQASGLSAAEFVAGLSQRAHDEDWPDTVTMRVASAFEHALGLTPNVPVCLAAYPFNLPQPNYASTFLHEFDLHLEHTLLIVCLSAGDTSCYVIAPRPNGDATLVVPLPAAGLHPLVAGGQRVASTPEDAILPSGPVASTQGSLPGIAVPGGHGARLQSRGHIALPFSLATKGVDHGYVTYLALPLDAGTSGLFDPLLGLLGGQRADLEGLLGIPGAADAVRDTAEDFLRNQAYAEIGRPVFHFDGWWFDTLVHNTINPDRALPRVSAATAGTPSGPFAPADVDWWIVRPNINHAYFERGLTYWDPWELKPNLTRMAEARYPWNQPEFFENVMEFWDDEHSSDNTPHQIHIHSQSRVHEQVQSGASCSADTGAEVCTGMFNFEEGWGWVRQDLLDGIGVYDPDQDLGTFCMLNLAIDTQIDCLTQAIDEALRNTVGWGVFEATPVSRPQLEGNPAFHVGDLRWWKRDDGMHTNRRIYSDLVTNSSYFLTSHHQSCEEISAFTNQVQLRWLDMSPRWKTTCPWSAPGVPDLRPESSGGPMRLRDDTVDPPVRVGSRYADILHPLFAAGTFRADRDAFAACAATGSMGGWRCGPGTIMSQVAADHPTLAAAFPLYEFKVPIVPSLLDELLADPLFILDEAHVELRYVTTRTNSTLDFFGMDHDGWDESESYVSVPTKAAEWPQFFGAGPAAIFRDFHPNYTAFHENITIRAPLLRAHLAGNVDAMRDWYETVAPDWFAARGLPAPAMPAWLAADTLLSGNPFWSEVSGQLVPFQDLQVRRGTSDTEEPAHQGRHHHPLPRGSCDGWFWAGRCHNRNELFDAGDLSLFGRIGAWDREDKPKTGYFPQGINYARYNQDRWVARTDPSSGSRVVERDPNAACWFSPIHPSFGASVYPPDASHEERRPLELTFWDHPFYAGTYQPAHAPNGDALLDPAGGRPWGNWCVAEDGTPTPQRSQREYLHMRLPSAQNGGDPGATRRAPITPYVAEADTSDAIRLSASVTGNLAVKLAFAALSDVTNVVDAVSGDPIGFARGVGGQASWVLSEIGLGPALDPVRGRLASGLPVDVVSTLAEITPGGLQAASGSPVLPLGLLRFDASLAYSELVVLHRYGFPAGTQGMLLASTDGGQTWSLLDGRGAPGVVGLSESIGQGGVLQNHLAFFDTTAFAGQTILLGARIVGPAWAQSLWTIEYVLPLAVSGGPRTSGTTWTGARDQAVHISDPTPSALAALPAGTTVLLQGPLNFPSGTNTELSNLVLVSDVCGGRACPIVVDGTLMLTDVAILPASEPLRMVVRGSLEATRLTMGALAFGLPIAGGTATLRDCWMMDTGPLGPLVLHGTLDAQGCVFSGQTLATYAYASYVRLGSNLFLELGRAAGHLSDSWGTLRDNYVARTQQAGFVLRGPAGTSNWAVFGNWIQDTGTGLLLEQLMEDRVSPLDPSAPGVPLASRTRLQDNRIQWAGLEAVRAGAFGAAFLRSNHLDHSSVGVEIAPLQAAHLRGNTLYTDRVAWTDPDRRPDPRTDGNVFAGVWQLAGPRLPVDARHNDWGPGPVTATGTWPVDIHAASGGIDTTDPLPGSREPLVAALTAPGHAGGQRVGLASNQPLSQLGTEDAQRAGSVIDLSRLAYPSAESVGVNSVTAAEAPVAWDVGMGITGLRVRGDYFAAPTLPNLTDAATAADVQALLAGLPLPEPGAASPSRSEQREIDTASPHGMFRFAFQPEEALATWTITHYRVADQWLSAGEAATKAATVHHSVSAPPMPNLHFLVQDLSFDEILLPEASSVTLAAASVQADSARLADAGLPMALMADGTLPIDGTPSLLILPQDQDPLLRYEMRVTDESGQRNLGGLGRTAALPAWREGETLRVEARSLDASGHASPWTGASLLRDTRGPSLSLQGACIASADEGIRYLTADWRDPTWPASRRPSGIGSLHLEAHSGAQTYSFDLDRPTEERYEGVWKLPPAALVDGHAYLVLGSAADRAGHAATAQLARVVIDLSGPKLAGPPRLSLVPGLNDYVVRFQPLDLGCGIDRVELAREVNGVLGPFAPAAAGVNLVQGDAEPYENQHLRFAVRSFDSRGRHNDFWTNRIIVNFTMPLLDVAGPAVGRTFLDGIDVGPAFGGATVQTPKPAEIPLTMSAWHPNATIGVAIEVLVNGVDRTQEIRDGVFTWRTRGVGNDVAHTVLIRAVGENGLTAEAPRIFYFPASTPDIAAEESADGWTFTPPQTMENFYSQSHVATRYFYVAGWYVYAKSTDTQVSTATWRTDLRESNLTLEAQGYLRHAWKPGRFDLLKVVDEGRTWTALYLDDLTTQLKVDRGSGLDPTATGKVLPTNRWFKLRLDLSADRLTLYVDSQLVGTYQLAGDAEGVSGIQLGGNGREGWLDQILFKTRRAGFNGISAEDSPDGWSFQGYIDQSKYNQNGAQRITQWKPHTYIHARSTNQQQVFATWNTNVPSARVTVDVNLYPTAKWNNNRWDLLSVMDGPQKRVSIYLDNWPGFKIERAGLPPVDAPVPWPAGKWTNTRLVLGVTSVDLYLDDAFIGSWPLLPPTHGVTAIRMGGSGWESWMDNLQLRTAEYGFTGLQTFRPILTADGWASSGLGTLTAESGGAGTVLRLQPSSADFLVQSTALNVGRWGRVTEYFRADGALGSPTTVLGLKSATGQEILRVYLDGETLRYSDGSDAYGSFDLPIRAGVWHRVDVELLGERYAISLDQDPSHWRLARPKVEATTAFLFAGQGTLPISLDRIRFAAGDTNDHSFTRGLEDVGGWRQVDNTPGFKGIRVDRTAPGFVGRGVLTVTGSGDQNKLALPYMPTAPLGSKFLMEVAIKPGLLVPDHMAALAGWGCWNGVNAVCWSVTVAPLGGGWGLYYVDISGVPVLLTPTPFMTSDWHTVRAVFDKTLQTLDLYVDEQLVSQRTNLGPVAQGTNYVVLGDIWNNAVTLTGKGALQYDDLVAFPL